MNKVTTATPAIENISAFEADHARTHKRWAGAVLGVYGIVVSIGILATLVHKSMNVVATAPATHVEVARR